MTETLAATVDAEGFDLLIAAAAGQKDAVIEMDIPKFYDPSKQDLYLKFTDIASELEKKINVYYLGTSRKDIVMILDPYLYSRTIKALGGYFLAIEKALDFIQNENIVASKVAGINIVRHILLDNEIPKETSAEFGTYNFKGVEQSFTM